MGHLFLCTVLVWVIAYLRSDATHADSYVLRGRETNRYLSYQLSTGQPWQPRQTGAIIVDFRTAFAEGLIAYSKGSQGHLLLRLEDGHLRVQYGEGETTLLSIELGRRLNDGDLHQIILQKEIDKVTIEIHNSTVEPNGSSYVSEFSHSSTWDLTGDVFIGGVPASMLIGSSPPPQFIGCISHVRLSNDATANPPDATVNMQISVNITADCTQFDACTLNSIDCNTGTCVNRWSDGICDCRTSEGQGTRCQEGDEPFDFSIFNMTTLCYNLELVTEPALKALESTIFSFNPDYVTDDNRTILHLSTPNDPVASISLQVRYITEYVGTYFTLEVTLPNGTMLTTEDYFYSFGLIRIDRFSDRIDFSVGFLKETIPNLEVLKDLDFSYICVGGGSSRYLGISEGILYNLNVNGRSILADKSVPAEVIPFNPFSVQIVSPSKKIVFDSCTLADSINFSFFMRKNIQNGTLVVLSSSSGENLVFKVVNGIFEISLGSTTAISLAQNPLTVNDGRFHTIGTVVIQDSQDLYIVIDIENTYMIPDYGGLKFCTNGITLGGDGFLGCLRDVHFVENNTLFQALNFVQYWPEEGVSFRNCKDPCDTFEDPCCLYSGTCIPLSSDNYTCQCYPGFEGPHCCEIASFAPFTSDQTIFSTPSVTYTTSTTSMESPRPSSTETTHSGLIFTATFSTSHLTATSTETSIQMSPSPTFTTSPPLGVLSTGDIIGIAVGSCIALIIIIVLIVILIWICMASSAFTGDYKTKENDLQENNLLKYNASMRSVSSTRPLHTNGHLRKENEYYM